MALTLRLPLTMALPLSADIAVIIKFFSRFIVIFPVTVTALYLDSGTGAECKRVQLGAIGCLVFAVDLSLHPVSAMQQQGLHWLQLSDSTSKSAGDIKD